ncbi:hypothetical protein BH24ACT8_BH24ACT8_11380 [soil metagenome]
MVVCCRCRISNETIAKWLTYADIAAEAVRGGWPALINGSLNAASLFARSYCDDLYSTDIPEAIGVRHEPVRLRRLMAALARNVSTEVTLAKLAADVGADGRTADPRSMRTYLDALARVFALDEVPAWSVRLRSGSRLRTSAKVHLADPSLACASLGVGPDRLARDPEFFGFVFESMVVRDVRAYASARGGQTYHYRDNTGLEIDVVVEYPDGSWGAVEAKLGGSRIKQAEQSLRRLRDERVDVSRVGQPAFLAVLTATQHAYTLPSGVHVVPLGVLAA